MEVCHVWFGLQFGYCLLLIASHHTCTCSSFIIFIVFGTLPALFWQSCILPAFHVHTRWLWLASAITHPSSTSFGKRKSESKESTAIHTTITQVHLDDYKTSCSHSKYEWKFTKKSCEYTLKNVWAQCAVYVVKVVKVEWDWDEFINSHDTYDALTDTAIVVSDHTTYFWVGAANKLIRTYSRRMLSMNLQKHEKCWMNWHCVQYRQTPYKAKAETDSKCISLVHRFNVGLSARVIGILHHNYSRQPSNHRITGNPRHQTRRRSSIVIGEKRISLLCANILRRVVPFSAVQLSPYSLVAGRSDIPYLLLNWCHWILYDIISLQCTVHCYMPTRYTKEKDQRQSVGSCVGESEVYSF